MGASPARISPSGNGLVVVLDSRQSRVESDSHALVLPAYSVRQLRDSIAETAHATRKVTPRSNSFPPAQPAGALSSFSSQDHRGTSGTTSGRHGREEAERFLSASRPMSTPVRSPPGFYARDARAIPSGQLGVGEEESPAALRPELAPVLMVCKRCRGPIRVNPDVRVSFCPMHGLEEFVFVPLSTPRSRGA